MQRDRALETLIAADIPRHLFKILIYRTFKNLTYNSVAVTN
ncbi:hypothetical protein QUA54_08165 [Microcoleus sp. MOSTC5]